MKSTLTLLTALLLALCAGNVPAAPQAGNLIHDAEMAGDHYLGSIGKGFAEANLKILESQRR